MSAINITPVEAPAVYPDHNKTTDNNDLLQQFTMLVYLITIPAMFVMALTAGASMMSSAQEDDVVVRGRVVTQVGVEEGDLCADEELGRRNEIDVDNTQEEVEEEKATVEADVLNPTDAAVIFTYIKHNNTL